MKRFRKPKRDRRNPFVRSNEGKKYAWAIAGTNRTLGELLRYEQAHPMGEMDVALTAALAARKEEMLWGE